jgi:hypothetical protein
MARGPVPDFPRDRPTVPELVPLLEAFYCQEKNFNGGALHVVLADGNLDVCFVEWCREQALECGDEEAAKIADLMSKMSPTQRRKAYHLAHEIYLQVAPR